MPICSARRVGTRGVARQQSGITYLAVVLLIGATAAAVTSVATLWSQHALQTRERQLLRVGREIRDAIGLYYERTPGLVKIYPRTLDDLLLDRRYPHVQRYLRRIYRDPMTLQTDWGIVPAPAGGIMGVYSLAPGVPRKQGGFADEAASFNGARRYAQWEFVYVPALVPARAGTGSRR